MENTSLEVVKLQVRPAGSGLPLPAATVEALKSFDAILLGAMGLPEVRWPNGVEMTPQIDPREQLDLYNGVRPIKLSHELHTPLKAHAAGDIDLLIVRENGEGHFSSRLRPRAESRARTKYPICGYFEI